MPEGQRRNQLTYDAEAPKRGHAAEALLDRDLPAAKIDVPLGHGFGVVVLSSVPVDPVRGRVLEEVCRDRREGQVEDDGRVQDAEDAVKHAVEMSSQSARS